MVERSRLLLVNEVGRLVEGALQDSICPKPKSLRLTRRILILKDSSNASHVLSSFGMTREKRKVGLQSNALQILLRLRRIRMTFFYFVISNVVRDLRL